MAKKATKKTSAKAKKGKKTGPKSNWKMTKETIGKLCYAFSMDCTVEEACYHANISIDTYYRWIKENPELSDEFTRLRERPVFLAREAVIKGIKENPELAMKYLERKKRNEFSTRTEHDVDGNVLWQFESKIVNPHDGLESQQGTVQPESEAGPGTEDTGRQDD